VATAKDVGCHERTVKQWKHNPDFLAAVDKAEDELYQDALKLLKKSLKVGITTLLRNTSERVPAYIQVSAAKVLVEQSMEVHSIKVLEQRLAELEDMARGGDSGE
jgi:hypothetical protein